MRHTITISFDDESETARECLDSFITGHFTLEDLIELKDDIALAITVTNSDGETATKIWG